MQQSTHAQTLRDIEVTNQIIEQTQNILQLPELEYQMLVQDNEEREAEVGSLAQDVQDMKLELKEFSDADELEANVHIASDEHRIFELSKEIGQLSLEIREKMIKIENTI